LVIHLERDGEMIMPHGITRLEAGDTLTLLSHHGNVAKLDKFWQEIIQRPIDDDKEETDCST
ncbi:MAG: TrkA C-terminal domain-containing protein, partial [Anaerolineales bacterium]